jgi:hypothetical protein
MKTLNICLVIIILIVWTGCIEKPTEGDLYNTDAAITSFDPTKMNLKPVNELIDTAKNTIGILYSNGKNLALVTWKRKTDPHWFGANIPGQFVSLETVDSTKAYHYYTGKSLQEVKENTSSTARLQYILGLHPVVMP